MVKNGSPREAHAGTGVLVSVPGGDLLILPYFKFFVFVDMVYIFIRAWSAWLEVNKVKEVQFGEKLLWS